MQVKKSAVRNDVLKELSQFDYTVSLLTLILISDLSEGKSKKAEKMSATTSTQTPMVSGDASSGSSVVAKKSAVVSGDSIANKSQKGIVGVSGMKEKKINLKVAPHRLSTFNDSTPCFRHTYSLEIDD